MNRWILEVSDFGKIGHAKVTVSPLTVFLGENNSGKSYLMTLIYGLLTMQSRNFSFAACRESVAYQKCFDFLKKKLSGLRLNMSSQFTLSNKNTADFLKVLNALVNQKKFLRTIFNKDLDVGQIKIGVDASEIFSFRINFEKSEIEKANYQIRLEMLGATHNKNSISFIFDESDEDLSSDVFVVERSMFYVMKEFLCKDFLNRAGSAFFLPTARTGFLLTYKSVVEAAMQDKLTLEPSEKNLLTKPVGDFLTKISTLNSESGPSMYPDLVGFIEKYLIKGHIDISEMPGHDIVYAPAQTDQSIPMYLTSGVVTELAPLALFLQQEHMETVLIEEPEISLHPELQISMAGLLIRMVNSGISTFVTTHSDLIVQHINNMIRLFDLKQAGKELPETRYKEADFIDRKNVSAYEFKVDENEKSSVVEVPCGDYGFEVETFYRELNRLSGEIDKIEEKMDV